MAEPPLQPSSLFFKRCIYFYFVVSVCPHVCMCTMFVPDAQKDQKKAADSLELKLQALVSHHVDGILGTEPRSSAIASSTCNH